MSTAAFIQRCVDAGMSLDMAVKAAEAFEAEASVMVERALSDCQEREAGRRAKNAARTQRYRDSGGGAIHEALRAEVFERDDYTCVYCGSQERLQCDHVVPVSKGGATTLENLATACSFCNAKKKDRDRKAFVRAMSKEFRGQNRTAPKSAEPALARVEDNPLSLVDTCSGSEAKASSPAPLGRQAIHRGSRLPADWQPSETDIAFGLQEGLTREEIARGADEFRDYWCALPGNRGLKLDWVRTFRNRLRELAGRKQRDGARLAARQGSGGGGRSTGSFADEFVRRHGARPD